MNFFQILMLKWSKASRPTHDKWVIEEEYYKIEDDVKIVADHKKAITDRKDLATTFPEGFDLSSADPEGDYNPLEIFEFGLNSTSKFMS